MKRSKLRRWAGSGVVLASAGAFALATAVPAAAAVTGTVQTAGDPLNVRRAPNTAATAVKTVANGASVGINDPAKLVTKTDQSFVVNAGSKGLQAV